MKKIELKSVPAASGMSTGVRIPRGKTLLQIGTAGTVWRVRTGAFRLERPTGDGQTVVHLALADDLVGVEALCAEPYGCTVTALVDSAQFRAAGIGPGLVRLAVGLEHPLDVIDDLKRGLNTLIS